jgi:hypothetical protein
MFLPSGRVHAIGDGLVIFEIQQNSDTTYRVFDWNRVGLDGKPRELHIAQSLASIDFNDLSRNWPVKNFVGDDKIKSRSLVRDKLFQRRAFGNKIRRECKIETENCKSSPQCAANLKSKRFGSRKIIRRTILFDSSEFGADGNSGKV